MQLCLIFFAVSWQIGVVSAGYPVKDCVWNGTVAALDNNCTKVTGSSILVSGTDDLKVLYTKFAHVEEINGCVQVSGTQFVRLDFFARVRTMTCTNTTFPSDLMISNNSLLERLGMPVLKINRIGLTFNPKICLTKEEATRFTNVQRGVADNITICQGRAGELKECNSAQNSMNAGLEDNCEIALGNLYIDGQNNANLTEKLQYLKEVNGRIYVRATNLNSLTIPLLEKIYSADAVANTPNEASIMVGGNTNFTKLDLPKINFMARNDFAFMTSDPAYVMDQNFCNLLSPFGNVMSNGTVCVPKTSTRVGQWLSLATMMVMFLYG